MVFSSYSFAISQCSNIKPWQTKEGKVDILSLYDKMPDLTPLKGYWAWINNPDSLCQDHWGFIPWKSRNHYNEALYFWENAENQFCIKRKNDDNFSYKVEDLFFFSSIDKPLSYQESIQLTKATKDDSYMLRYFEFFNHRIYQLYAFERLGKIKKGFSFPDCNI